MSDEIKTQSPAPEDKQTREAEQAAKAAAQTKSQKSVVRYLSVLFVAAFALLLFTLAMEMRQHQQAMDESQAQIEDLNRQSISAVQKLEDVVDENLQLKDDLKRNRAATSRLQADYHELQAASQKSMAAMDWFWQLNEAYAQRRYDDARDIIASMEEAKLVEFLPKQSATANESLSPFDRYAEIKESL